MVKEPTVRRKRAYELPNLIRGQGNIQRSPDQFSELQDQNLRDLAGEYKVLRIEEMLQKKRNQLSKGDSSSDSNLQKGNLDLVTSIFKLVKEAQPQQSKDDTLAYVTLFKDLMLESTKIQNQGGRGPSFFESIITDPTLYERTKDIFSSGKTGDTNKSDIEIERLRGEREMSGRKMDLEIKKLGLEAEERHQRLAIIMNGLSPILTLFGAKTAEDMRQRGMDMGRQLHNPNPSPENTLLSNLMGEPGNLQGQTGKLEIRCDCGFSESMLVPIPPPQSIACPNCGKKLLTGPQPGTGDEEDAEWKRPV
ncbi:hypothetical protein ES703_33004 [subsurface metagenome]